VRGRNIEDTVRAIAEVRRITPALHFDGIDVFGIDLWPKVAGDILCWESRRRQSASSPGALHARVADRA